MRPSRRALLAALPALLALPAPVALPADWQALIDGVRVWLPEDQHAEAQAVALIAYRAGLSLADLAFVGYGVGRFGQPFTLGFGNWTREACAIASLDGVHRIAAPDHREARANV